MLRPHLTRKEVCPREPPEAPLVGYQIQADPPAGCTPQQQQQHHHHRFPAGLSPRNKQRYMMYLCKMHRHMKLSPQYQSKQKCTYVVCRCVYLEYV